MGNKRIRTIVLAGALGAAVVLTAPPVYQCYKNRQAEQLSAEALRLLADGKLAEAADQVRMAYSLAPQELTIVRRAARVAQASNAAKSLPMWEQALKISVGEAEDRLGLAEAAMEAGRLKLATKMLTEIREDGAHPGHVLYLEGRMLALEGRPAEAAELLQEAWKTGEAPENTALMLGKLARRAGDRKLRKAAESILREKGRSDNAEGLAALRMLVSWRSTDPATLLLLSERLEEHPLAVRDDALSALLADERMGRLSPDEVSARAAQKFNLGSDDELLALVRWLITNGRNETALGYLGNGSVHTRADLFEAWAEAMYQGGQWDDLKLALEEPVASMAEPLRYLFLMRVFRAQQDRRNARLAWQQALESAAEDSDALWTLACQTMAHGLREQAREVLWRLSNDQRVMRTAYQGLIEIEQSSGNTRGLLNVLQQMSACYPEDKTIRNDFAYIQVLLDEDMDAAISTAETLVEEADSVLPYRVTLACARMRQGKKEEAMQLLNDLDVRWGNVSARWQIVLAWILLENGREAMAREVLRQVDETEALLPEERGLLTSLRWELEPGIALPLGRAQS